ncbi:PREDICTED: proprotein convertase subtilisin/kexin type 4-like, partial [Cariama cristata]|uniref:proprotein convertase subtilisin/kexin type 4-like n=1 Tax=Cariama cristata TaxID=54380 RepID=UPI00052047AC
DPLASYDFNSNDPDPQPRYTAGDENWHGTRCACAGEVAAAANNRICGAGVAYNAKVGGVRMLDGPITDLVEAQALSLHPQHIHIPALTWRDLQHLVIRSSKPAHLQAEDWAVNGVGRQGELRGPHHCGYGLLDAGLLVEMAKAWAGTRPQRSCSVKALHSPRNIGSKLTVSADISFSSGRTKRILSLEHVQVQLSLSYSRRGDLAIALTSPMGTTSTLVTVRPYDTSQEGYKDWTFMSTHFWDENPNGTWTLQLENKGDACNTGLLTSFILHLHGTDEDMTARRFAGSAVDECIRRDAQGACQECGSSLSPATNATHVWASCHPSCYTCQGASANNCTSCPSTHTFHERSHSCSPPQGSPTQEQRQSDFLPVLICSSLILSAILCVTYRVAFCIVARGSPTQEQRQSDFLPVLICSSLILSAILCVTYRVAFCI